jgi:hypothetical protein
VSVPLDPALDLRSLRTDRAWLDWLTDVPGAPQPGERVLSYEEWAQAVRTAGEIGHAPARDAAWDVLADVARAQVPRSCNSLSPDRLERKGAAR